MVACVLADHLLRHLRARRRTPERMRRLLVGFFATIGFLTALLVIVVGAGGRPA